jgi:hypothetical protein
MVIEIDTELLIQLNLTPTEFVFLTGLHKKANLKIPIGKGQIEKMEGLGYIKQTGETLHTIVLRQKFIDLVEGDFDQMFNELLTAYPMKVGNPQNMRVLHAMDARSKSNQKAREKYKKIVDGRPHVHKKIMECLDNQLKHQRSNLQYMQLLDVWINNATWEKWDGIKIDEDEQRQTRIL